MPDLNNKPLNIIILDPFALIRAGLRSIIEAEPGLEVIGEAGNSADGLEMVACRQPDILLLKLCIPGDPGVEIIPKLLEKFSKLRIILLTTTEDFQTCLDAVQFGVVGVVSMTLSPVVLIKAIRKVSEGELWIERSMMARLLKSMALPRGGSSVNPDVEHIGQLSDREHQVIQLIGSGMKNKQIAIQLCISEATVRHHLTSIFNKLGVSDRLELLVFANRWGLTNYSGKNHNSTIVQNS